MKRISTLLFALLLAAPALAAVPRVHITGTLYNPTGAAGRSCTLKVKPSSAFELDDDSLGGAARHLVMQSTEIINVADATSVSFYLVPNSGQNQSPAGTYYDATVTSDTGTFALRFLVPWSVSAIRVSDILINAPSLATQSYVPVTGGTFSGTITFNGTPSFVMNPMTTPTVGPTGSWYTATDGTPYFSKGGAWTSAVAGLSAVSHDSTLTGNGTGGSPLGVVTSNVSHGNLAGLTADDHPQYGRVDGTRAWTGDQSFGQHKLAGILLDPRTSAPSGGLAGQAYVNTSTPTFNVSLSGAWVDMRARGTMTGTQTKSTISDFAHATDHSPGGSDDISGVYLPKSGGTLTGDLSFGGHIARSIIVDTVTSDPANAAGRVIFRTDTGVWKYNNGSAWIDPIARANHTGTQLRATISDFAHASTHAVGGSDPLSAYYLPLAGGTMTGNVTFGNYDANQFRLERVSANPTAGVTGRIVFNTTLGIPQIDYGSYVGSIGVSSTVVVGSPITGNGSSGSPLGFDATAVNHNVLANLATGDVHTQYVLASGLRGFTGNVTFGGFQIQNARFENTTSALQAAAIVGNKGRFAFLTDTGAFSYSDGTHNVSTSAAGLPYGIPITGASSTLAITWLPLGTSSSSVCVGNDTRLSDARTPSAHAASHAPGSTDPLTATYLPLSGGTMAGNMSLGEHQLTAFRVENVTSNPAGGNAGRMVFNTTLGRYQADDGATFSDLPSGVAAVNFSNEGVDQGQASRLDFHGLKVSRNGTTAHISHDTDGVTNTAILAKAVTYVKLQDETGLTVLGRGASSTGVPGEIGPAGASQILAGNSGATAVAFETPGGDVSKSGATWTVLSASAAFALSGVLSPSQITSTQNNYSPTSLSTSSQLRLYSDASRTITGLAGGAAGRVVSILNVGGFDLVLSDADTNSTAANRFAFGYSVTLNASQSAVLQYDATNSRWMMLGATRPNGGAVSAIGATTANGTANTFARSDHTHAVSDLAISGQTASDILKFDGTNWVRVAKGSNSTVLQVSSGGTLQYGAVTDAMMTGSTLTAGSMASSVTNRLFPAVGNAGRIPFENSGGAAAANNAALLWDVTNNVYLKCPAIYASGQGGAPTGEAAGFQSYDSTQVAFRDFTGIGAMYRPGSWYAQTTDSTQITAASETAFDNLPTAFPANTLTATRVIRWHAVYLVTTSGAPTYRLRYKLGTAVIIDTGTGWSIGSGVTNVCLVVDGCVTIRSVGPTGTYASEAEMHMRYIGSITAADWHIHTGPTDASGYGGSPSANIDTTASDQLADFWTWSTTGQNVRRMQFVVDVVR